jgi:lysozyme
MNIAQLLEMEEGYSESAYYCSEKYPTIGIGKRIGPKNAPLSMYEFKVSRSFAQAWLLDELINIEAELSKSDWFCSIVGDRRIIIIAMAYQLGVNGLLKFKKMITAISICDWVTAANEAKDSRWYKQTTARADRCIKVMLTNKLSVEYK